jgi:metacaspase-1
MTSPKGLSLHIGLNRVDPGHYAGWSGPLVACEADADDMATIARKRKFGVNVLKTAAATRKAVLDFLDGAARELKTGDLLLLSYSGHGGQLPDRNGDEADLRDETWCLYDGELVDDELLVKYCAFAPGVRIFVLSDSCHSGTVTRAAAVRAVEEPVNAVLRAWGVAAPRPRMMPPEAALATYRKNAEMYDAIQAALPRRTPDADVEPKATVRLLSGCQDNQTSSDGDFNGLFTGTLLQIWNEGRYQGNHRRFANAIVAQMPPTQSPNHLVIGPPDPHWDRQKPFTI